MRLILLTFILTFVPILSFSASESPIKSHYAGQEKREIKSLSESDIEELRTGKGWGLAKAAELNGVPGPAHLLELKKEIGLSEEQVKEIETLYQQMQDQAIPLGNSLIEYERELNAHFANGTIDEEILRELLEQVSRVQMQLRLVHLSTHLKTPGFLTARQINLYNDLRGYSSNDPCKNIPAGHDPEMWKMHNNCP